MFVVRLLPFVNSLSERKWSDEDIVDDIDYLKTQLASRLEGLT
jgi:V-type H+-transporting ATPase subunit H